MESLIELVPQLEPIQQLAPYLNSLSSVSDAVRSFNELADLLDSCDSNKQSSSLIYASSPSHSERSYSLGWSPASSGTSSLEFSSAGSFSSHSPASISSLLTSDETAVTSSVVEPQAAVKRRRGRQRSSEKTSKNASASERYRCRLKGRDRKLYEQLEREHERNRKLRQTVSAKLSLYREFALMLAENTADDDLELASLGLNSVGKIVAQESVLDRDCAGIDCELSKILTKFQKILSRRETSKMERLTLCQYESHHLHQYENKIEDSQLVYDFYTDRFIDSYPSD